MQLLRDADSLVNYRTKFVENRRIRIGLEVLPVSATLSNDHPALFESSKFALHRAASDAGKFNQFRQKETPPGLTENQPEQALLSCREHRPRKRL